MTKVLRRPAPSAAKAAEPETKAKKKDDAINKKRCVTHEARLSFPALLQPKSFDGKQDAKYSCVLLFDKKVDLGKPASEKTNSLRQIILAAAKEKWGPREEWPKGLRMPLRDGDESDTAGYAGHVFCTVSSKTQPGIVGPDLNKILDPSVIYAGCYVRAEIIAYAYDTMGNRGIGLALQNIQKTRDGTPFTGRKDPSQVFDAVEDTSDDEDSYEDDDDDFGAGDDEDEMTAGF